MSSSEMTSSQTFDSTGEYRLRIEPTKGLRSLNLGEVWEYRELLWFMTIRDIKGRYRQMALGPLWIILQPVVNTIVLSIIFGTLAKLPSDELPYPLFTYASLTIWNFFTAATGSAVSSLVSRMGVISKVYFPRLIVPIGGVISAAVDMGVSFIILAILMLIYGYPPSTNIVFLPLFILLAAAAALGIGLWSAAIVVRFRDFGNIISYGLRFGMYATPVAYATSAIPEQWLTLYRLNPMFWAVEGFRWSVLGIGQNPQTLMLVPVGIVLVLLISGSLVFRKAERTVVDWL